MQHVGMAAQILGARMQRNVDAVVEGAKIQRRRPGIVEHAPARRAMRDRGDRRNVLNLEGQRARRLGEHDARVGRISRSMPLADQRIVVADLDAQSRADGCCRSAASGRRPNR